MYMHITVVYYSNVNKYKWNGMNKREGGERGRGEGDDDVAGGKRHNGT